MGINFRTLNASPTIEDARADVEALLAKSCEGASRWDLHADSFIDAAAEKLHLMRTHGQALGVDPVDWYGPPISWGADDPEDRLVGAVVCAVQAAFQRGAATPIDDPLALLVDAATRAGRSILRSDMLNVGDYQRAFITFDPKTATPPWGHGLGEKVPLVVFLAIADDGLETAHWRFSLAADLGKSLTGRMRTIIALPPSPGIADEVMALAAMVLDGAVPLADY